MRDVFESVDSSECFGFNMFNVSEPRMIRGEMEPEEFSGIESRKRKILLRRIFLTDRFT